MTDRPADWKPKGPFRFWRADFERDTRRLNPGNKWRYIQLLACMWENGGIVMECELGAIWGPKWRNFGTILEQFCLPIECQDGKGWTQKRVQHDLDKQWKNAKESADYRARSDDPSDGLSDDPSPSPSPSKKESPSKSPPPNGAPELALQAAPSGRSIDDEFDEFYRTYPRRVGRKVALSAYKRARKGTKDFPAATHGEILTGVERYVAKVTGKDPRYIAHPSTWLNQGRWLDDEPVPPKPDDDPWQHGPIRHAPIRPDMPMPQTEPTIGQKLH